MFQEAWERRNGSVDADRERPREQLTTLQQRKHRLLALVQDGVLEAEEFRQEHKTVKADLVRVEAELAAVEGTGTVLDCDTAIGYFEHLLYNQHV